jgi:hypothetical protein
METVTRFEHIQCEPLARARGCVDLGQSVVQLRGEQLRRRVVAAAEFEEERARADQSEGPAPQILTSGSDSF